VLLLFVWLIVGVYVYYSIEATDELKTAIAETEKLDPRWRLEDVEADRAVVPEAKNSALVIVAIKPMMPAKWPAWDAETSPDDPKKEGKRTALQTSFAELESPRQLNAEQIEAIRAELKRAAKPLTEARKLSELPDGRYPILYAENFIGTLLPHLQDAREIAALLQFDVLLRAQEEDGDGALASCRAILNASRSIGDEPVGNSQLARIACRSIAVSRVQRTLAQCKPSDAALRQLQELLEKDEKAPLMLFALRGERGGDDRFLDGLASGKFKLSPEDLAALSAAGPNNSLPMRETLSLRLPASLKSQRAAMLRFMTRAVEIAKKPPEKHLHEIEQLQATVKDEPIIVRLLAPALGSIFAVCERSRTQLRCAIVAVAAERYRRDKGKWPDKLETLHSSDYLKKVPTDPFDGKPLRMSSRDDGLVIYSVGADGEDNGGFLNPTNANAKGSDLGFRLWNTDKRRQPPAPPKAAGEAAK
jgi:hypothetical protein